MKILLKIALALAFAFAAELPAQTRSVTADGNGTLTWPANLTSNGTVTAATLAGNLSAANLTGTIADARLSGNVVTTTAANTTLAGNLTAANLTSNGTVTATTLAGNLSAANLTGTIADARLSGNVVKTTSANTTLAGNLSVSAISATAYRTPAISTLVGSFGTNLDTGYADTKLSIGNDWFGESGTIWSRASFTYYDTALEENITGGYPFDSPSVWYQTVRYTEDIDGTFRIGRGSVLDEGSTSNAAYLTLSSTGSAQFSGNITTAGRITGATVTSNGTATVGNLTTAGSITGASVTSNGTATVGNLTTAGSITGATVTSNGTATVGNLTTAGSITGATVTSNGTVTVGNLTTAGSITGATVTSNGTATVGNLTTAGTITGATVTSNGTATVGNLTTAGSITGATVTSNGTATVGNLTTAGTVTAALGNITGNFTAGNVLMSGNLYYWTEHFIAGSNAIVGWTASNSNGSSNTTPNPTSGTEFGLLSCMCGTTAAVSRGGLSSNSLAQVILHPSFNILFSAKVAPSTAIFNNSTDTGTLFLGLGTVASTAGDATSIEFRAVNGGNWTTFVGNGTSNTTYDTGIAQSVGTYNAFSFVITGNSSVTFYTTNLTTGTHTTLNTVSSGLPTANLGFRMISYKGSATTYNAGFTLDWATIGRRRSVSTHPNF